MTNVAFQRDVGEYIAAKAALNPVIVTAATTADGQEINGTAIDRQAFTHFPMLSCKVIVEAYASLTAAKTATLAFNLQDAVSSTGPWADYNDNSQSTAPLTQTNTIGTTATTAANTPNGVTEGNYSLGSAKRWLRVQVTPTLSATVTDTVDYGGVIVFGGFNFDPAS
jgi:hypothetical protein